jgi:GTPase
VHVIDCATLEPGRDPMSDLDVIENELSLYVPDADLGGRPLAERTRIVVLNKADVPEARELAEMVKPDLEARGIEVFIVSAVAHQGLRELTFAMARHVEAARQAIEHVVPPRVVLRPRAADDQGFTVTKESGPDGVFYRINGARPVRWVRQTDFSNDEAVGYLADRLGRLGVEEQLFKVGAVAGDTVVIGPGDDAVVFDWEPTLQAGAELLGNRGTDLRLSESSRPTRDEKRESQRDRYAARAATQEELEAERRAGLWQLRDNEAGTDA